MRACRRCGAEYGPQESLSVPFRALPNITLTNVQGHTCTGCADVKYGIPQMDVLLQKIAQYLVEKRERLTGKEARFLRKWLGWSGQDTAKRLGFTAETVSRWENEKIQISEVADKFLRSLVIMREPIHSYSEWDEKMEDLAKISPAPLTLQIKHGNNWVRC